MQRDITIIDSCISIVMPMVRAPQMYQGLLKLHKEDRNVARACCYGGDYAIVRSGSRGFHFFEINTIKNRFIAHKAVKLAANSNHFLWLGRNIKCFQNYSTINLSCQPGAS